LFLKSEILIKNCVYIITIERLDKIEKIKKDIADLRKFIEEKFSALENIISTNEVDEEFIDVRKY